MTDRYSHLARVTRTIENSLDWNFNIDEFDDRFKMQKYIFFADYFDAGLNYDYGLHIHGPYSPDLAEDYYDEAFAESLEEMEPSASFNVTGFEELISNRPNAWLEWAATLTQLYNTYDVGGYSTEEDVLRKAIREKTDLDSDTAKEILRELDDAKVISRS